ncbi:MAG: hypothetical protein Q8R79_07080 [Legionellaceae bacterium]|nr:hypothetical protein [Legionellaceae bacterium]
MPEITKQQWEQRYPRLHSLIVSLSYHPCPEKIWWENPALSDFFNTESPSIEQANNVLISYEPSYGMSRPKFLTIYYPLSLAIELNQKTHFEELWRRMLRQIDHEMPSRLIEMQVIPDALACAQEVKNHGGDTYFYDFLCARNILVPQKFGVPQETGNLPSCTSIPSPDFIDLLDESKCELDIHFWVQPQQAKLLDFFDDEQPTLEGMLQLQPTYEHYSIEFMGTCTEYTRVSPLEIAIMLDKQNHFSCLLAYLMQQYSAEPINREKQLECVRIYNAAVERATKSAEPGYSELLSKISSSFTFQSARQEGPGYSAASCSAAFYYIPQSARSSAVATLDLDQDVPLPNLGNTVAI